MGCWADEFTSLRLDFFLFYFWLCLFIAILGLFSSCGEWGLFSSAVRGLLILVAFHVAKHGL